MILAAPGNQIIPLPRAGEAPANVRSGSEAVRSDTEFRYRIAKYREDYLAAGLAGASSSRFARSCARMSAV